MMWQKSGQMSHANFKSLHMGIKVSGYHPFAQNAPDEFMARACPWPQYRPDL